MKCLECGHDLTVMNQDLIGFAPANRVRGINYWSYSHTECRGHCKNCLCDWEWDEIFENGQCTVTQPIKIFWG